MSSLHELATLTSKGQVTLPKSIRQILGVNAGSKLSFELRGGEVVVTRVNAEQDDPAIGAFLDILTGGIRSGAQLHTLPDDLAAAMKRNAKRRVDLDAPIDGDTAI